MLECITFKGKKMKSIKILLTLFLFIGLTSASYSTQHTRTKDIGNIVAVNTGFQPTVGSGPKFRQCPKLDDVKNMKKKVEILSAGKPYIINKAQINIDKDYTIKKGQLMYTTVQKGGANTVLYWTAHHITNKKLNKKAKEIRTLSINHGCHYIEKNGNMLVLMAVKAL